MLGKVHTSFKPEGVISIRNVDWPLFKWLLPSPLWTSEVLAICSGDSLRPVREADILALLSTECCHPAGDPAVVKILYSGFKVSKISCSRARTSF